MPSHSSKLINQRRFPQARAVAWEAALKDPRNPARWVELSLAANLTSAPRLAFWALERARTLGCNDDCYGDGLRDHALNAIRQRRFNAARRLIDHARQLHAGDSNRLACLDMVEGRLREAIGQPQIAYAYYQQAYELWCALGDQANRQWMYNLYVHWLLSAVRLGSIERIEWLVERIETQCPEGAKNRSDEAKTILKPWIGPNLYKGAIRLRMTLAELVSLISR